MIKYPLAYLIYLIIITASCSLYPADVELALKYAGDNRSELEKVLEYYRKNPDDSLKYRAACFLIANMLEHATFSVYKKNPSGQIYDGFINNKKEYDSLSNLGYTTERVIQPDITHVDYSFLVEHIELAFKAWSKPWSRNVSFFDFCRYILPYRSQFEPLSSLRSEFFRTYGHVLDTVPGLNCSLEACRIINKVLADSIRFHVDLIYLPVTRGIEDAKKSGIGQCDDLCNFGIHVMRSVGIPVVGDRTLWARMNYGHTWCSVLCSDGEWHAFSAGEDQPGKLIKNFAETPRLALPKVYRTNFERQPNDCRDNMLKNPTPPAIFTSIFARDVTSEYIHTPQITVDVDVPEKYAFLCVFNLGSWQAVDYSPVKNGKATFRVGNNIIYMPHIFRNDVLIPCGEPFLLEDDRIRKLVPDFRRLSFAKLTRKTIGGDRLFYWDVLEGKWLEIIVSESNETELFFENIPENALFWHYTAEQMQRIGVFADGSYIDY